MAAMSSALDTNGGKMLELCCEFYGVREKREVAHYPPLIRKILPPTAPNSASVHPVGYDVVILSDLLHFSTSHDALLLSLTSLLAKNRTSRAYVAAGNYTPPSVCDHFLREGEKLGIIWQEGGDQDDSTTANDEWRGALKVSGLEKEQLATRKNACRWWLGRWLIATDPEAGLP